MDVRRPPPPARFEYRIRPWLNRKKLKLAFGIGGQPAFAREVRIDRRGVAIGVVDLFAGRVGLPDLDHRAGNGRAILIGDAAADLKELSSGPRSIRTRLREVQRTG